MKDNAQLTRRLLACGIAAGPIYIIVGVAQILTREGFDMTRHPLSMMSLGDLGWIQITNFLVTGALVVLGAVGLYRAREAGKGWRVAAVFVGLYGIGVFGGGIFSTDPSLGFPPGTPNTYPETMTTHALLHFIFGQLGFLALIIASFIYAWYFGATRQGGWAAFSALTGIFFIASIVTGVVAMESTWALIPLWVAVALSWVWLSALTFRTRAGVVGA